MLVFSCCFCLVPELANDGSASATVVGFTATSNNASTEDKNMILSKKNALFSSLFGLCGLQLQYQDTAVWQNVDSKGAVSIRKGERSACRKQGCQDLRVFTMQHCTLSLRPALSLSKCRCMLVWLCCAKQGAGSHDAELLSVELAAQSQLFDAAQLELLDAHGQRKLLQAAEFFDSNSSSTLEQLIAEAADARDDSEDELAAQYSRRKLWGLRGGDKRTQDVRIAHETFYFACHSTCFTICKYSCIGLCPAQNLVSRSANKQLLEHSAHCM
jgi:hypothetical protein